MSEFAGKVVLITGAAGNLRRAVAAALAAQGAHLALVDLNEEGLAEAHKALPTDCKVITVPTNLLKVDLVTDCVATVQAKLGGIDVLANIAGGFTMGPLLHDTADKDWDFMMNLNARSVFNMARAVVPGMLAAGGGRIVNVSARAAREGKAKMGPYCASKAAVITLTETLAAEHKVSLAPLVIHEITVVGSRCRPFPPAPAAPARAASPAAFRARRLG